MSRRGGGGVRRTRREATTEVRLYGGDSPVGMLEEAKGVAREEVRYLGRASSSLDGRRRSW